MYIYMFYKRYRYKQALNEKDYFRLSSEWKKFKKLLIKELKVDLITKLKLSKTCLIHHLKPSDYYNLDNHNMFICLNVLSHLVIEFFNRLKDWRPVIKRLIIYLIIEDILKE